MLFLKLGVRTTRRRCQPIYYLMEVNKEMAGILAKKIGMTQIFENGKLIPVTVVEAGPNYILQKKTVESDGYTAVQLGFDEKKEKNTTKPILGIFKKAGVKPQRFVKELRVSSVDGYELGQEIKADVFNGIEYVDVIGTSKGKGTSGVMKRHGFSGNRATHGVSLNHRLGGSIGMSSFPGKVLRGKRMAGKHGNATVTVQNLKIVKIDAENNVILLKGAVPGSKNGYIVIQSAVKKIG
jgi:large subunit ribosomal protein L3